MEISFQVAYPGSGLPFFHKHRQNEELYVILKGSGEFHVDDAVFPIQEGSVIRVRTSGARMWKNTSEAPMLVMAIQAAEGTLKNFTTSDGYMDQTP